MDRATGGMLADRRRLLEGLDVDEEAMRRNLEASPFSTSERVLTALSPALGKHRAQARLQELLERSRQTGTTLEDALLADDEVRARLPEGFVPSLAHPDTGGAGAMVDEVLTRAAAARASEPGHRM